jgi:hypothetical protein
MNPARVQCLQWDNAYLQVVNWSILGGLVAAAVAGLLIGVLFARHVWWATRPVPRITVATTAAYLFLAAACVGWPHANGLGRFFLTGVPPDYRTCETMSFGAKGILSGLVGSGVAAYAQGPAILALLAGACAVGGLIAFTISVALTQASGLKARAIGGKR